MNCKHCGAELYETSRFCPECGEPVEKEEAASEPEIQAAETAVDNFADNTVEIASDNAPDNNENVPSFDTEVDVSEINASELTENLPEIKKIDDITINEKPISEDTVSVDDKNAEADEEIVSPVIPEEPQKIEAEIPATEDAPLNEVKTKKGKGGVLAAIIIVLLIAAAAVYFVPAMLNNSGSGTIPAIETTDTSDEAIASETEPSLTEIEETASESESETISETAISETEATTISETEASQTGSEESETELTEETSETSAISESSEIVIIPEGHVPAMGFAVSAEISLKNSEIAAGSLSDETVIAAFYSTDIPSLGEKPIILIMHLGDISIEIEPSAVNEGVICFDYSALKATALENGFSEEDIDILSFRSNGPPLDVVQITINYTK